MSVCKSLGNVRPYLKLIIFLTMKQTFDFARSIIPYWFIELSTEWTATETSCKSTPPELDKDCERSETDCALESGAVGMLIYIEHPICIRLMSRARAALVKCSLMLKSLLLKFLLLCNCFLSKLCFERTAQLFLTLLLLYSSLLNKGFFVSVLKHLASRLHAMLSANEKLNASVSTIRNDWLRVHCY